MAPPFGPDYRVAQVAAREAASKLSTAAAARIADDLRRWSARLAAEVATLGAGALPSDTARRHAAEVGRRIIAASAARLDARIAAAVQEARDLSFAEVRDVWLNAQRSVAEAAGLVTGGTLPPWLAESGGVVPLAATGRVAAPRLTMAAAYERLGSAARTWKTALPAHVAAAADDLDGIVRESLLAGVGPEELARRLRPYVLGAEKFEQAFPAADARFAALHDLRKTPAGLRGAAQQLRYNALRIAYSETWNARAEAELESYALDPAVAAVRWRLSPSRGQLRKPDICDAYARTNWYGLGPGVFPLDAVPLPPHPFCRCAREPVLRDFAEWGKPKPTGIPRKRQVTDADGLKWPGLPPKQQLTDTERARVYKALKRGFEPAKVAADAAKTLRTLTAAGDAAGVALRDVAGSLPGLFAAAKAAALPPPPPPPAMHEVILAKKVGAQAGSNPGGLYLGSDGVTRYVKFYADPAQAQGEAIANALYRRLGLGAPESVTFATPDGKIAFASTIIEGVGDASTVAKLGLTPARANAILDGVVADVFLANWDVVGLTLDNVVEVGGAMYRIDNGSAFLFRAQGGKKPAKLLNALSEWTGFAPGGVNAEYARVFKAAGVNAIDDLGDRAVAQIKRIEALRDELGDAGWNAIIDAVAPDIDPASRAAIVGMLDARLDLLTGKRVALEAAAAAAADMAKRTALATQIRTFLEPLTDDPGAATAALVASPTPTAKLDDLFAKVRDTFGKYVLTATNEAKAGEAFQDAIAELFDASNGAAGSWAEVALNVDGLRAIGYAPGIGPNIPAALTDYARTLTKTTKIKTSEFWGAVRSVATYRRALVNPPTGGGATFFDSLKYVAADAAWKVEEVLVKAPPMGAELLAFFDHIHEQAGKVAKLADKAGLLANLVDPNEWTVGVATKGLTPVLNATDELFSALTDANPLTDTKIANILNVAAVTPGMQKIAALPLMEAQAFADFLLDKFAADIDPAELVAFVATKGFDWSTFYPTFKAATATPMTGGGSVLKFATKIANDSAIQPLLKSPTAFGGKKFVQFVKEAVDAAAAAAAPVAAVTKGSGFIVAQPAAVVDAVAASLKGVKGKGATNLYWSLFNAPPPTKLYYASGAELAAFKEAILDAVKTGDDSKLVALGHKPKAFSAGVYGKGKGWAPTVQPGTVPAGAPAPAAAPKPAPSVPMPTPKAQTYNVAGRGSLAPDGDEGIVVVVPRPNVPVTAPSVTLELGQKAEQVLGPSLVRPTPVAAAAPAPAQRAGQFTIKTGRAGPKHATMLAAKKAPPVLTPDVDDAIANASALKDTFYLNLTEKTHDLVIANGVDLSKQWSIGNVGLVVNAAPTPAKFSSSVNKVVKLAANQVLKVRRTHFAEDVAEFLQLTPAQYEALSAQSLAKKLTDAGVDVVALYDVDGKVAAAVVLDPGAVKVDPTSAIKTGTGSAFEGKPTHPKAPTSAQSAGQVWGVPAKSDRAIFLGPNGEEGEVLGRWDKGKNTPAGFVSGDESSTTDYLTKNQDTSLAYMTPTEKREIVRYTGGAYGPINAALRRGEPPTAADKERIRGLWKTRLKKGVVLNRGCGGGPGVPDSDSHPIQVVLKNEGIDGLRRRIGRTFTDRAFGSYTTRAAKASGTFSYDGVIVECYLPPGTPGAYLEMVTQVGGEKEFLLPPGAKVRILGVVVDGQRTEGAKVRVICELVGFDDT